MRAILLAAGFGTRLKPLTNSIPKCLVPIDGKPILDIWLNKLCLLGIGPVIVNTHYLSEQVSGYLKKSKFCKGVFQVFEPELLGTAGTLIKNKNFFCGEDGMLIHADNYCEDDLVDFIDAHKKRPQECLMTMMTFRTDSPSSCGIVELDECGVVVAFHEKVKDPPGNLANGAIYILSKELLGYLEDQMIDAKDFSNEVIPRFMGKISAYETTDIFIDIGTPEAYKLANDLKMSD